MVAKTVLITGGLGCLGGSLSKYLTNAGFRVIVGSSRRDAKLPNELDNCSLVYTDFDNFDTLADACYEVDSVIHLATVNAQQSQNDPQLAIKVNGIGTYNLIQASIKSNVEYFLYFSSAHVYNSPLTGKIDENTIPRPLHPYSITHRLAEDFLLQSINSKHIKGEVIRLSNSVGLPLIKEANCWMLFINDVCKQAIIDHRIVIHSNPGSERDFIPINAVCEIAKYFLSNQTISDNKIFNVGSGISYTLLQIAQMIAERCKKLFDFYPEIICPEYSNTQNLKLEYKVNKLTAEMGYTTNNNLHASIDEVLKFCNTEFG